MNVNGIVVDIRLANRTGSVQAYADVHIELPGGSMVIYGFAIIEKDGKPPWVGFPSKQGKIPGKYFPIVAADGDIEKRIVQAILEAYQTAKSPQAA
jgi:DNA-binding cell septation regulator SpoVG